MDKETLSNYGWIVICVMVIAVMIALASPFGTFVSNAVKTSTKGVFDTNRQALSAVGIDIDDQKFDGFTMLDATDVYKIGSNGTLSFRSSAPISVFQEVRVDGEVVDSVNYVVTEGSTIVTFTTEYSDLLNLGDHTVEIVSNGGSASADFKVIEADFDTWDGTADTSWYNDTDTEFMIMTAEQLAGFSALVDGGITFSGKTVKVGRDINLNNIQFNPIGSYGYNKVFSGTFDAQNHTISNLKQEAWELGIGSDYSDSGLGLFGKIKDATIKNLHIDKAIVSGSSSLCGAVSGAAYGTCVFENITVSNTIVADYIYYAGGIVAWASGNHQYIGINIEPTTTIGGQWGCFGNANGGIIGGMGSSAKIHFKDCNVACKIDATNDVVSAYQWYNYRNSGMLIGKVPQTITQNEVQTVKTPENVTCENVTVIYGDWVNYTYCQFTNQEPRNGVDCNAYPWVRVQPGTSCGAYSNIRYGVANVNGVDVIDDNHTHTEGEGHHVLIQFNQLFGGPADHRYCYYGIETHPGVTIKR